MLQVLVGRLVDLSLVSADEDTVAMHRLVGQVVRDSIARPARPVLRQAAQAILIAAGRALQQRADGWQGYSRLYPHALAVGLAGNATADGRDLALWLVWALRAAGDHPNSVAVTAVGGWASFPCRVDMGPGPGRVNVSQGVCHPVDEERPVGEGRRVEQTTGRL
jgi:hypothetical protein